jgi:hypothetical protein
MSVPGKGWLTERKMVGVRRELIVVTSAHRGEREREGLRRLVERVKQSNKTSRQKKWRCDNKRLRLNIERGKE